MTIKKYSGFLFDLPSSQKAEPWMIGGAERRWIRGYYNELDNKILAESGVKLLTEGEAESLAREFKKEMEQHQS